MPAVSTPPFIIKVCGITREDDGLAALDVGVNALGFNFYPKSPRYLTLARAQAIVARLPKTYLKVGVFVNASVDELVAAAAAVPLDVLQLHGKNLPLHLTVSFRIWQATGISASQATASALYPAVEAYLLDTPSPQHGGSGRAFDWSRAANFSQRTIIAGGLDHTNVAVAIQVAHPWGVDACSRLESQPGLKDHARVQAFVRAAQSAFRVHQEIPI